MQMRILHSSFASSLFRLLTSSPQGRQGDPGPQGIDGACVSKIYRMFFFLYAYYI